MSDFIGDSHRECITHHNACDCREAKFKRENELAERIACFIKNRMGFLKGDQLSDAKELVESYFYKDRNEG